MYAMMMTGTTANAAAKRKVCREVIEHHRPDDLSVAADEIDSDVVTHDGER